MSTSTREIQILFSDEMVRSILEGRKTQTRRPVKLPPALGGPTSWCLLSDEGGLAEFTDGSSFCVKRCPFGRPGDVLWVREAFYCDHVAYPHGSVEDMKPLLYYRERDTAPCGGTWTGFSGETMQNPWTPSIHMPRWASRLQLLVKNTWIERVQSISEDDAEAEGFSRDDELPPKRWAEDEFRKTWDSIYAKRGHGWDQNPYVDCCEFEVI